MGLLTILKKNRQKEKEMRLLMLGLDNAGKTTILKRINGEDINTISPTLGFNIKTLEHDGYLQAQYLVTFPAHSSPNIILQFSSFNPHSPFHSHSTLLPRDVGGQKSIRSYWRNYFEQTDALVWVVDSADRIRLDDCRQELHSLLQEERLAGATLLVFANKQDLPGAVSDVQLRKVLDLDAIATHHWAIQACSAVTGENLLKGMNWVVTDVASRIYMLD
ncbi:P-loop containing nucleoside triphosphate hydrolase protein [Jimgerdemannia flammicorona]|uniref:P-loop containing nucleoside triphosphate hydrolase protein n=1 Tax=Jimgerdemannia flammicorona TaxID=994334 RepID=A0A433B4Q5_9FUNG|nr:P-loop containing nucleoside triphosphate hydrolase protein [Jimgerdemannia flammicorona]